MNYYIADAFAETPFTGNPAGVCLSDGPLSKDLMQKIAAENNLSETAFLTAKKNDGEYDLKWFTPVSEIDLCGHATLASAFVITEFAEPGLTSVCFHTQSGVLPVKREGDLFTLDFPTRKPVPAEILPVMEKSVGARILEAHKSRDLILLLDSEETVKNLTPDFVMMKKIGGFTGVCVTAQGKSADFVSRYFAPEEGIPEDPVTGSSHCSLAPFWAERLGKTEMTAKQLSKRGGKLLVKLAGERTYISGKASLYMEGRIIIQ